MLLDNLCHRAHMPRFGGLAGVRLTLSPNGYDLQVPDMVRPFCSWPAIP